MSILIKGAAPGRDLIDSPPRLGSSRCGNYNNSASNFNQSSSGVRPTVTKKPEGEKMNQELVEKKEQEFSIIEQVVMQGDLSKLNPEQRVTYYRKVCESSGLNPFTNPFAYITLNGKLTLYAKKDCTEQLRKIHGVSIEELEDKLVDDVYVVTAKAKDKTGRIDQAKGAVVIGTLKGEAKANAIMKAETKAKRRVTLSICGMGWTDESEIDSIPNARPVDVDFGTGEIKSSPSSPQVALPEIPPNISRLTPHQITELEILLEKCDEKYRDVIYDRVLKIFKTHDLSGVTADLFESMKMGAIKNMKKNPEVVSEEIQ